MRRSCLGLVQFVADRYTHAVEIGIGRFPDVALALARRGVTVFATDIRRFFYPGVRVVVDDVTHPAVRLYARVQVVYALRPPPELIVYLKALAGAVSADLIVKPLASDFPEGQKGRLTRYGNATFFLWSRQ